MEYIIENIRLKELKIIADKNKDYFYYIIKFLNNNGYKSLHDFVNEKDDTKALHVLERFLAHQMPDNIKLYDGVARAYKSDKAKWLMCGWILRDAPEQRLRPILSSIEGNTYQKKSFLINEVRKNLITIFPDKKSWEWHAIIEVVIDRLEGSRRAIKGNLFEAIVRRVLIELFKKNNLPIHVSEKQKSISGETYDIQIKKGSKSILVPVKTRETMGGGHSNLFTRDIHKAIRVAYEEGHDCLPIIIAESWTGNLADLDCKDFIYINMNPNQIIDVTQKLTNALVEKINLFRGL